MGSSTSKENEVRVWERMSGSMGWSASPARGNLPVKTARPRTADTPHKKTAEAMNTYPRNGCAVL
jgi:hypothetical protein